MSTKVLGRFVERSHMQQHQFLPGAAARGRKKNIGIHHIWYHHRPRIGRTQGRKSLP
jgi:hypothetical protein